jgi:hypothetical protein
LSYHNNNDTFIIIITGQPYGADEAEGGDAGEGEGEGGEGDGHDDQVEDVPRVLYIYT